MRQMLAISWQNLRSLGMRWAASSVVIIGIAGVVFVLTAMLAMANGLQRTLAGTGQADRVLILHAGSNSEINGAITREQAAIIVNQPGIARDRLVPLASAEIYATGNLNRRDGKGRGSLPLRGVSVNALRVRPEVRVIEGRAIVLGRFEMMIGKGANAVFAGLAVGKTISIKGASWHIVGLFTAAGSATESEAWIDVNAMASVFHRGPYLQSITARLTSPQALSTLRVAIDRDPRLALTLLRESDYYQAQSESATRLIRTVGTVAAAIMSLGAIFAALNTLYAAVSVRTREIAILKVIGFSAFAVVASVLVEALMLSLLGGALGAALAWLAFDGAAMSSLGAAFGQVAFYFAVTGKLMLSGVMLALLLGMLGGLPPALRAARMNVIAGLRDVV